MAELFNKTKECFLAEDVEEASHFWSRTVGLLGRSSLDNKKALWIHSCRSIHTFFMKFSIDAVFVDKNLVVKAVYENLKPWRMTLIHPFADSVFEFNGGVIKDKIQVGDQLYVGT